MSHKEKYLQLAAAYKNSHDELTEVADQLEHNLESIRKEFGEVELDFTLAQDHRDFAARHLEISKEYEAQAKKLA